VQKAAGVANESWRLLNDALAESDSPRQSRYPGSQTSPF